MKNDRHAASGVQEVKTLRLDKFLKVSRLIKRRSLANDACDTEHISVNGRLAKPGAKLKIGDVITLRFGQRETSVEVLSLEENVRKEDSADMYRVIE